MMGWGGKQEEDNLVQDLACPSCPHVRMEKEVLEQLGGQFSPIFIISLNYHPMPRIKTKMDFVVVFFFLFTPFYLLKRGQ